MAANDWDKLKTFPFGSFLSWPRTRKISEIKAAYTDTAF
jgi:hypothetical protein